MSKSRLEKFLYALYSLDSSDLPNPLSRIEELYKCWVTGEEAPTFEPLSRVEKYLMAILGVYDVNELPNPISRVEVLLYKLAIGDDNLDDIKSFLSEHEELLAEIIRNGGAGGNIDIEYVLYNLSTEFNTLYNTAEKPVKSAILKGRTLVNSRGNTVSSTGWSTTDGIEYIVKGTNSFLNFECTLLPNAKYLIFFEFDGRGVGVQYGTRPANGGWDSAYSTTDGICKEVITTGSDSKWLSFIVPNSFTVTDYVKISRIMIIPYQDGMENWDIPYFEGMQSVKMPVLTTTGKNLFDGEWVNGSINFDTGNETNDSGMMRTVNFIKIKPNTTYIASSSQLQHNNVVVWSCYDENKNFISSNSSSKTFISPSSAHYLKVRTFSGDGTIISLDAPLQIEEGVQATTYEPFKSNILTTSEEVELHGVGEVKDELDLVTGEVTQRIGEVVFDGSEDWEVSSHAANSPMFYTSVNNLAHKEDYLNSVICDKLMVSANSDDLYHLSTSPNGISAYKDSYATYPNENWFYIKYTDSEGSVEKLKQWLSQNPVTVRYELTMESVKTVDLSVVDQDGNNTELSTFDDLTHVTLSSEGLIPEAELEVATKNEEDLEVAEKVPEVAASMLTISREQEVINATTNEQSENVDATMIATTEIYEDLL